MTEPTPDFRMVLRGYDPGQVDARVRELEEAAGTSRQELDRLTAQVRTLESQRDEAPPAASDEPQVPPTFEHLGARVGQILSLAEEEAEEIRQRVVTEMQDQRD